MEDLESEINEIACAAQGIQNRLRQASRMAKEQPQIAITEIGLVKDLCGRIYKRLEKLTEAQ